jgi:LTXXQ motif family protein
MITVFRIAATILLTVALSNFADAKPGGGGGKGGGHHARGHHGGGGHHAGKIARGGGRHFAVPHRGPRVGMRHATPRGARSFHAPRAHVGRPARFSRSISRPRFHDRSMRAHGGRQSLAARSSHRPVLDRRALRDGAARQSWSDRATRQALRSARVHARADARAMSPAALGAFSGRGAQAAAGRAFRDPALLARHRFDATYLRRAGFAGAFWPGPYFWPYAYYDETFWLWPSVYDDVFWSYGYNDILSGIYRPHAASDRGNFVAAFGPARRGSSGGPESLAELCGAAAPGLTEWPVDEMAALLEPTQQQRMLLDALIKASDQAAETLRAACPRSVPVTPIGRLDAMQHQLAALEQAVRIVHPALKGFYDSLSDDQKERFNALGPKSRTARRHASRETIPQPDRLARACETRASEPADWPIDRIEQAVRPDASQRSALSDLAAATAQAAKVIRSACPAELPLTPTGRLSLMQRRTEAMRQAVETLRPALARFYAALNDEQKARFNRALSSSEWRVAD